MDSPFGPSSRDGDADADDTYQTPNDDAGDVPVESPEIEQIAPPSSSSKTEQDVVTGAARNIRNLLKDMLDKLKSQSDSNVTLSGDFKLTIGDRQSYALALSDASNADDSRLIIKIDPISASSTTAGASAPPPPVPKHYIDYVGDVETPAAKRRKPNGQQTTSSTPDIVAVATARRNSSMPEGPDGAQTDAPEDDPSAPFDVQRDLKTISKQVKWVEQCRRTASAEYHQREERWRTTSATFHDQNRMKRERQEAWVAAEMARQTNMLGQVINDVKGLYPLLHSVKWELPTAAPHPLYATPPAPHYATSDTVMGHIRSAPSGPQYGTPTRGAAPRGKPRGRPRGTS